QIVTMPDGSKVYLKKLDEGYNPYSKVAALTLLHESHQKGEFATGLLYIEPDRETFTDLLNTVDTPLSMLTQDQLRPPKAALDDIMDRLR
ncbi:MAG: 2-oxoacid:ferredoxin oxidoreductase subunit beta, partial [Acidobacteria bacterium]|nr:2-oxoacid:ferredoxin oxidoreductase subunit beta [Acidobacteriota bacterium]